MNEYICQRGHKFSVDHRVSDCPECGERAYPVPPEDDDITLVVRPTWYISLPPANACRTCGGSNDGSGVMPCVCRVKVKA
jgi:hypothetical protein